ncbi:MAG: hypothetical protein H7343_04470, partial [Undibacterium sp.]|nr:hypothetical protein [Opitutaceae bacterium]
MVAQPVAKPPKAGRSMTHVPEVPQSPTEGTTPEYRASVTAIAARYHEVYYNSDYPNALVEARNGIKLAAESGRSRDEAEFIRSALYVTWLMGESEASLDYGQRLLQSADQLSDDRLRSFAHRVLGSVQRQLGNRPKLREETQLAYDMAVRARDEPLRISAINNLGNIA